jgi:hypothetical protein
MLHWLDQHTALLSILAGVSVIVFVGSLIVTPLLVAGIPEDYFAHEKRPPSSLAHQHPIIRISLLILKNTLGVILITAGIAMLLTPGQGLLTALIGFLMIDFPGKYRVEQWMVGRPRVLKMINWIRRRKGKSLIVAPPGND